MSRLRVVGIIFMEGGQQVSSRLASSIEQIYFHFNTPPIKAQRKVIHMTSACETSLATELTETSEIFFSPSPWLGRM
jgi:hypothetical protein